MNQQEVNELLESSAYKNAQQRAEGACPECSIMRAELSHLRSVNKQLAEACKSALDAMANNRGDELGDLELGGAIESCRAALAASKESEGGE